MVTCETITNMYRFLVVENQAFTVSDFLATTAQANRFTPLGLQLSLAIEIMVKCSHAGPSNKSVDIF